MEGRSDEAGPLASGQVLESKYRVGRALGSGTMGLVYEAYHLRLQKAVAIKVLRPELAVVEDVRDRFEAEARAAAAVGHPNIVSVTDLGQTPSGALYFVMDRLRGETLGERLDRLGKLEVAAATTIILEVLEGLAAAHELKLVHRDLKPDNIFLARPPGGREIPKILDFGIAKALASVGRRNQGTRVGITLGTPLYMAPEQALAAPDIDARVDIYAIGVILYQVLSGRPPFDGKDAVAVLGSVLSDTPPPLAELCPTLPAPLVQVIEAAMSRDRDRRPASAGELAERLRQALAASAITRAPASRPSSAGFDARGLDTGPGGRGAPVLLDLAGNELPAEPAAAGLEALPEPSGPYAQHHDAEPEPLPLIATTPTPAAHPITATGSRATPPPAAPVATMAPLPRGHSPLRALRWLVLIVPLVAVGGLLLALPRLRQEPLALLRQTLAGAGLPVAAPAPAPPPRPTALVEFDVTPRGSRLFLDGAPLAASAVSLGKGEMHTITAVADGYDIGASKFFVDQPKTVRLRLQRGRARR